MDVPQMKSKLKYYGAETLRGIHAFVPEKEPKHYLYDLILDYPNRGGKGFRPGLCIASCKAHGGKLHQAKFTAVTLEMLHNAFLIHDDVEDESAFRRNKPTMHNAHSRAIAINVGDMMNALSLYPLWRNKELLGDKLTQRIFLEVYHLITESAEGQALELGWRQDNQCHLTEKDYLRMILKKTCWYTCIQPIRMGALIGSNGVINPDSFNRLGYFMGAAFQIQDDILNLIGEESAYGKEIGGDIIEGKRTLMLIDLLSKCSSAEHHFIKDYLGTPMLGRDMADAKKILELMHHYKSIDHAKQTSQYLAGAALKEFYTHFSHLKDSEDKAFIETIIMYMINRDY
ncbi:polyprenyl synthetase family protein [Hwangdonia lutea]|uniref:Polyprenyl synthetase family protein n=1 Tax=Hwangdonia lutea TaxID=3075823 RepID=A0AA97HPE6_9FLAO|nr:polyprenyl synthetase family protein [Hwangdonia sp. SCSIO 19198]WOD42557.1 polyprenyl synthetase family protein [Hwangdonia sp. SCSIO 19198]